VDRIRRLVAEVPVGVDSAVSVAWSRAGGHVETAVRGCAPDSLFQAGSISKAVTSVSVHELVAEGRVLLDSPVNDVMDGWSLQDHDGNPSRATFRQLLAHTAGANVPGFPGYPVGAAVPKLDDILEGRAPAVNAPIRTATTTGELFGYSGGGYCVLQYAIEDVSHSPFSERVRRSVIEPAGMTGAVFADSGADIGLIGAWAEGAPVRGGAHTYPEQAAAGLCCSAADLVRFGLHVIALIHGSQKSRDNAFAVDMVRPHSQAYALGFEMLDLPGHGRVVGHAGSNRGFKSMFAFDPKAGTAAAVMINDDRATLESRGVLLGEALGRAS
jgi:CubicO group peptidase (beta-lactamase class C family)